MLLIVYCGFEKTYNLLDLDKSCKYPSREFKSLKAAQNFCKKNNLTYKIGVNCDG